MILKTVLHVENLLKQNEKFVDKDGNIFKQNVLEAIEKIDKDLVKLLISDEKTREQFFIKIDDVFVLEQNKLIEFFTMNEYFNNSFTSYTNKIGLIKKDSFIKKFDDVVLAWPHKDCILEGGQSKDDEKNNEVFYNEILSRDEIDRLFEPKALTNIKRYSVIANEVTQSFPTEITEDDNLIIKGNNLIALHSLKKKYAGKVKLIYIDPPYNTGNDSFKYNDRFNHSTWLTFMKNRLEVAREFLSEDGVIFVSIDDNEQAYLKVLMDELFQKENFVANVVWKKKYTGGKHAKFFATLHEYILVYSKNSILNEEMLYERPENEKEKFNLEDEYIKERGKYYIRPLKSNLASRKTLIYPIELPNGKFIETQWLVSRPEFERRFNDGRILIKQKLDGEYQVYMKYYEKDGGGKIKPSTIIDFTSNNHAKVELKNLFNTKEGRDGVFEYPKPEALIKHIIEISTQPNDLVMDFHLGSGTTCAVAHKMNRRYIGIEQMDYIEDIAVERMKKVIEGEQGGISKAVNWQGGGSFIYAELKQIDTFKDAEIGKLNANMHYLPFTEIEDAEYGISKEEITLNKNFYGLENE